MNLSLILDPVAGNTLVDTSMPGNMEGVETALAADGLSLADVRQIIVTHQDIDHIGSLAAIKERTRANVIAHSAEVPYIEGRQRLSKYPSQERLDQNPGMKEMYDRIGFDPVDQKVEDNDLLNLGGGTRILFTPGHTPGHISLFLERSKTIISGDALTSENGRLKGPLPHATPDFPRAIESVAKLAALPEVSAIVTYHGGLVTDDPLGQLRELAA